jgi:hypothetical protein
MKTLFCMKNNDRKFFSIRGYTGKDKKSNYRNKGLSCKQGFTLQIHTSSEDTNLDFFRDTTV